MIRGNEKAIDLGLDVLAAIKPGKSLSKTEIAAYIDAAREVIGGTRKPFTKQDMFFLEDRALRKMRMHAERLRRVDILESLGLDRETVRQAARCRCGLHPGHPGNCRGVDPRKFWGDRGLALQTKFARRIADERTAIVSLLREHGSLTIHQIRNLAGLRLSRAKALTQCLRAEGAIACKFRGRYSHYEPVSCQRRSAA